MGSRLLASGLRPVFALMFNAMVWGLTWWPMRQLQAHGVHPLWATALIFAISVVVIGLWRPQAWGDLLRRPALWGIVLAAGVTNASFNWGITEGDVVKVVLLFYLMPLWAVILARLMLHEPITPMALVRVSLSVLGAVFVLWPAEGHNPLSGLHPIDMLGLLGGFSFAVNNVLLRHPATESQGGRGLAMFLGGCLVSMALTQLLNAPALPLPSPDWLLICGALAACYLCSNLALQYGASRLPANATSVIMLTEVLWATGSAIALGAGRLSGGLAVGGGLILASAVLAALRP
jgi:drug/metabolite transporter (DMT)-like permease